MTDFLENWRAAANTTLAVFLATLVVTLLLLHYGLAALNVLPVGATTTARIDREMFEYNCWGFRRG